MANNLKFRLDEVILKNPELLQQPKNENVEDALAILLNLAHARQIELDGETALKWLSTHDERARKLSLENLEELAGGAQGITASMRRRADTFTGRR
ncbi:MAG TPA: hypothetical protein VF797_02335 [Noviherbaspirillum sp.]